MSVTIPENGVLITAEDRPHLRSGSRRNAAARGSRLVHADPRPCSDEDMAGFDYVQFKENVAIGLEVAACSASLGATQCGHVEVRPGRRRRAHQVVPTTSGQAGALGSAVRRERPRERHRLPSRRSRRTSRRAHRSSALLNNRSDRGRRAELFAHMVPNDLAPPGPRRYARRLRVTGHPTIVEGGYPASTDPQLRRRLEAAPWTSCSTRSRTSSRRQSGVLIGMVNIHTHQAELLLEHFAQPTATTASTRARRRPGPGGLPPAASPTDRAGARARRSERPGSCPTVSTSTCSADVVRLTLVVGV